MLRLNGDAGRSWAWDIETADSKLSKTPTTTDLSANIDLT
jgi:hypothetical protein